MPSLQCAFRPKSAWLYPAAAPASLVVIPEGDLRFLPCGYTHPGIAQSRCSGRAWLQPRRRCRLCTAPSGAEVSLMLLQGLDQTFLRTKSAWLYPAASPASLVVIPEGDLRFPPCRYTHPGSAQSRCSGRAWLQPRRKCHACNAPSGAEVSLMLLQGLHQTSLTCSCARGRDCRPLEPHQ